VVAENDIANDRKQRDYTYLQREEEHRLIIPVPDAEPH